jgi:putative addiction module component (TIGR02574 family)
LPRLSADGRFFAMGHPLFDFRDLTPAERVELAIALWDSLPDDSSEPPLSDAQRRELGRRVEAYRKDPSAGAPWDEVRARIRSAADSRR